VNRSARIAAIALTVLLGGSQSFFALNPSLEINQYGHTAWKIRDGFPIGTAFAMAQTPDGYLWLGTETGLFRSDGVRFLPWTPPAGQHLPGDSTPYSLLVSRDGTLWIGTFKGLASWRDGKLTQNAEVGGHFVTSLLEDRDGTVWAALFADTRSPGQLCAIRNGGATECYGRDGAFGSFVWSLAEYSSGTLWVGADSGLWRWKPGPPKRYGAPGKRLADLAQTSDGRLIAGIKESGLWQISGDKIEAYPIRSPKNPNTMMAESDVDANKLLRDRDGGLWIGTNQRGLIHVHQGRTDVFTEEDGLSGNIIAGLFEDHEGNIWVSTAGGLDRFRDVSVVTVSPKQGLPSRYVNSVLASTDGSVWIATREGLTQWQNGKTKLFRRANGLPDQFVQSLYQDNRGRVWAFTKGGLAYYESGRFVAVPGVPSTEVYSITGDDAGNLWLSGQQGLSHLREGRLVEHLPWSELESRQQAKVIIPDHGGLWLAFWDGAVEYFKDNRVTVSFTDTDGLGKGFVASIRLDKDGAVWAATQSGGVSRIKDGKIINLTTNNGLPCDKVHWTAEDNDRAIWINTGCGLVRILPTEVKAWIADPKHRVQLTVWDAADGAMPGGSPSAFGPTFAQATDGKIWYQTREDIQVVDPRRLAFNSIAPPVHIEKVVADDKTYWDSFCDRPSSLHLPPHLHALQIYYAALSLGAPEKIHFRYKLEDQDGDWREVVNDRDVQYSNLGPGTYRFRVIACNNSGIWNEQGDALDFVVEPAYYQTNWFRALCAVLVLGFVWAIYRLRVRHLHREFALTLDARVAERTSVARELHDTLLQSFHGLMLRFELVSQLLPERPVEAKVQLDGTIERAAKAITEGRDAVQGLRASTVQTNDLARTISTLGEELAADPVNSTSPALRVTVEGHPQELHPLVRDEIYRVAAEALRNAFQHAHARQIEVEMRYEDQRFRLRVRDDGRGIDTSVLSGPGPEGHFGLRGMRERAKLAGGKVTIWSEVGAGTEVELQIPAASAYSTASKHSWLADLLARK
jgi:signal transduction histidine kinase/ligand-binding sensor domain-containing protein